MQDVVKTEKRHSPNRRKRRRNLSLYYFIIVVIAIIVLLILSRTVLFNSSEIIVNGVSKYTEAQILEAADIKLGDNLFKQSPKAIENKLIEKLVYIESAEIKRQLPDSITINVTEAKPFACCEYGEGLYAIVSQSGKFLEVELTAPQKNLLLVKGSELETAEIGGEFITADPEKSEILFKLFDVIAKSAPDKFTAIDLTTRVDIVLHCSEKLVAEIGSFKDYEYKIKYVSAILEKLPEDADGKIIYHSASAGVSYISQADLDTYYAELARREEMANAVTTTTEE